MGPLVARLAPGDAGRAYWPTNKRAEYGNWVGLRLLYLPGGLGIACLFLSLWFPLALIGAGLGLALGAFFAYVRYEFSPRGGDLQTRIRSLVVGRLNLPGGARVLDVGCGNGPLVIAIAQRFPSADVTGVDLWGGGWGYSKAACEFNARIAGVSDKTSFQRASASALPFPPGSFDAVVSNLVFHEVRSVSDKRLLLREALRVVKKGGTFAIQDLFRLERAYGDLRDLLEAVRSWGIENVEYVDTSESDFIPWPLKAPFIVGTMGLLCGKK